VRSSAQADAIKDPQLHAAASTDSSSCGPAGIEWKIAQGAAGERQGNVVVEIKAPRRHRPGLALGARVGLHDEDQSGRHSVLELAHMD